MVGFMYKQLRAFFSCWACIYSRYSGVKVKALSEPVNDKVFFVGEHTTILNEIETMEAAVESGDRIANLF